MWPKIIEWSPNHTHAFVQFSETEAGWRSAKEVKDLGIATDNPPPDAAATQSSGGNVAVQGRQMPEIVAQNPTPQSHTVRAGGQRAPFNAGSNTKVGDKLGLRDKKRASAYCKEFCALKSKWNDPGMGTDERLKAVDAAINRQLADFGVPHVPFHAASEFPLETAAGAVMHQVQNGAFVTDWNMYVNPSLFNTDAVELGGLGTTLFHEAQHAVQHFAMARYLGSDAARLGLPANVTQSAIDNPSKLGDGWYEFGRDQYNARYGPDGPANQNLRWADKPWEKDANETAGDMYRNPDCDCK